MTLLMSAPIDAPSFIAMSSLAYCMLAGSSPIQGKNTQPIKVLRRPLCVGKDARLSSGGYISGHAGVALAGISLSEGSTASSYAAMLKGQNP
jgi:hypothetical protein